MNLVGLKTFNNAISPFTGNTLGTCITFFGHFEVPHRI